MSNYRIAIRYAKSLMVLSIEQDLLDAVRDDMEMLYRLCRKNRSFQLFLKNPVIHNYKKQIILKKLFEKKIHDLTFKFIEIITRKSREDILPDIAGEFLILYNKEKRIEMVDVFTPVKLDPELRNEFERLAKHYTGEDRTIILNEVVKEDLIGGFILKIGDRQIDDSVSSKLREMRKKLIVS